MAQGSGLLDFFGSVVSDIRQKVVEEPWFGRSHVGPDPGYSAAADLGWTRWKEAAAEPNAGDAEHDRGAAIERDR